MAKDKADRKTGNLPQSAGARRQAELAERRAAAGYKRSTVWIHQESYDQGVNAAQLGSVTLRDWPDDCIDVQSWVWGYANEIQRFEQARRKARLKNASGMD